MLTKTRTTLITLIAAGSFATATVAPAVSQARPIDFATSIHIAVCEALQRETDEAAASGTAARKAGKPDLAKAYFHDAQDAVNAALAMGCAWAQEIVAIEAIEANRPPVAEVITTTPVTTKRVVVRPVTLAKTVG